MKKAECLIMTEVEGYHLCYDPYTDTFLLLTPEDFANYSQLSPLEIKEVKPDLYNQLKEAGFYVEDDFDFTEATMKRRAEYADDKSLYSVMLNTTLDCNLNCWYCYENRIPGSMASKSLREGIKKHIGQHFQESPFETLKLSFFGGEPFLNYEAIKDLAEFGKEFCGKHSLNLILDFTTNATLITPEIVDFLSQFRCHFQITLDGGRDSHNCIKRNDKAPFDTYAKTLESMRLITKRIPSHLIAVRLNFDAKSLNDIDSIINDISFLDRRQSYVILRKVWQVGTEKVNGETILSAIDKLFENKFLVDYYVMPRGCVCFAERKSHVFFNYDGKVFRCSTICSFDEKAALGNFDQSTGSVTWDKEKYRQWFCDMQTPKCKACKWFPACLGVCNKQHIAYGDKQLCTFDAMSITQEEFLMYLFKHHCLYQEIYGGNEPILD